MVNSWVLEYTKLSTGKLTRDCIDTNNIDSVAKVIANGNKSKVKISKVEYSYSIRKPAEPKGK
jgi:hypothetical protein